MNKICTLCLLILVAGCHTMIKTPDGDYISDQETFDNTIYIKNRSFEKGASFKSYVFDKTTNQLPSEPIVPDDWNALGVNEKVVALDGSWARYYEKAIYPKEGAYYLSLNLRDDTPGIIAQELTKPMLAGAQYDFSFSASNYQYTAKIQAEYDVDEKPCQLEIWGQASASGKKELLYRSLSIEGSTWKEYKIKLKSSKESDMLMFKIVSQKGQGNSAGNILLDDLSNLLLVEEVTLGTK